MPVHMTFEHIVFFMIISVLGGVVAFFRKHKNGETGTERVAIAAGYVCVSVFAALLTHYALTYLEVHEGLHRAAIGLASYMGGSLLDAAEKRGIKHIENGKHVEK
ncbi:MAG: phage holin family protein [Deferribacteraceae bacterium]|jgi:hypothetical protein|nr:phage holin family protein [Deferribacteraceae bacterium]